MKKLPQIVIIILIVVLVSCDTNQSVYYGTPKPTRSGFVKGSVIDSTSQKPIANVNVMISDIIAGSEFTDTAVTDFQGKFEIKSVYEKDHYLSFKTMGYKCKNIYISVVDTLEISKEINLERIKYPYKIVPIEEMPTDSTKPSFYYKLDPSVYLQESFGNWHITYNASESEVNNVKAKVDSVIITLLRNNIKPDTLWYKFYQSSCNGFLVAFDPVLVVKLKEESEVITEFNFIPHDFEILLNRNCVDSSHTILRNTFFDI